MSIVIVRQHALSRPELKRAVEEVVIDLQEDLGLKGEWTGEHELRFHAVGVGGVARLGESDVVIEIKKSLLLPIPAATLRRLVESELDERLAAHAADVPPGENKNPVSSSTSHIASSTSHIAPEVDSGDRSARNETGEARAAEAAKPSVGTMPEEIGRAAGDLAGMAVDAGTSVAHRLLRMLAGRDRS